jgi:hypothetical protein
MTIRYYLRRFASRSAVGAVAFLLVVGMVMSPGPRNFELRFIVGVIVAAVMGAVFWNLFRIPCPSCQKPLGSAGFWAANGSQSEGASRCPHCGIAFEAAMPMTRKD